MDDQYKQDLINELRAAVEIINSRDAIACFGNPEKLTIKIYKKKDAALLGDLCFLRKGISDLIETEETKHWSLSLHFDNWIRIKPGNLAKQILGEFRHKNL
jgi:hypothetical protein